MTDYIAPILLFEQNGQDFKVVWQAKNLPAFIYYEIEDEYGRIIKRTVQANQDFLLPKLGVGYYHLRFNINEERQDSMIIIAPNKAFCKDYAHQLSQPITSLKQLRQVLQEKKDLHYLVPFPRFSDLAAIYRLKMQFTENQTSDTEYALFLALKSQYKINRDFQDWSNCCYDFNKINSYKCKEYMHQNSLKIARAGNIIAQTESYLRKSIKYLQKQGAKAIAYMQMPIAADYQSFEGWKNRKMLLAKPCKNNKIYVPYSSQILKTNFYSPIIEKIRFAMQNADILVVKDYETLEKNICSDFPFSDKEEKYDSDILLAILKIESRRHQCVVMATATNEISTDFIKQSQNSGIVFIK